MRDDMFEVIIERPRLGSRMGHFRRARRMDAKVIAGRDPDLLLSKLGMQRGAKFGRSRKWLNENLAPLRRYLERQVNRPWDKVWSEISANISASSTVQQHVRDHITDFVAIRGFIKDGTVFLADRYGTPVSLADSRYRLYVDPRTGLLRKNKHFVTWQTKHRRAREAAAKHRATRMRELADDLQVHKLDDNCWWEVRLAPIPTRRVTYPTRDGTREYSVREKFVDVVASARLTRLPIEELYGRPGVYAIAKRQISRREIADLRL